ncbi:MAG: hypothetical protein ACYDAD_00890, partial [Acidimicrobiales bacterium]
CPFHAWRFDGAGLCTEIPYSDKLNRKARLRSYPVIERNGLVMAWYHPEDAPPSFEIPEVEEYASAGFTEYSRELYRIASCWQEMTENSVDSAHFRYVHGTGSVPEVTSYTTDGHTAVMRSVQRFLTPQGEVDGQIDVYTYGAGMGVTWFRGIVDTVMVGCTTPVDEGHSEVRFNFMVRKLADERATSTVGEAFMGEVRRQMLQDIPIWEHKAYLPVPALADTDGPIMQFRRWAQQFYVQPDRPVSLGDRRSESEGPPAAATG